MRYKKKNLKIVVVPHYSGSVKTTEVFRKVIAEQIEKKLNKSEKKIMIRQATIMYHKILEIHGRLMYNKDVE